jgi:hypothetical protein
VLSLALSYCISYRRDTQLEARGHCLLLDVHTSFVIIHRQATYYICQHLVVLFIAEFVVIV